MTTVIGRGWPTLMIFYYVSYVKYVQTPTATNNSITSAYLSFIEM